MPSEPGPFVADVWEAGQADVQLDVLLPNGYFLNLTAHRETTLKKLKEDVWRRALGCPLSGLLLEERDKYVFQCVRLAACAECEDLDDEARRLCDARPFQAVLRLVERREEKDRQLNSRIGKIIGLSLGKLDLQENPEVEDFRRTMRAHCESAREKVARDPWKRRVLRQHPLTLETRPEMPAHLRARTNEGTITLCVRREDSESHVKIAVDLSWSAEHLLELVLSKKGGGLGLEQEGGDDGLLLKICGIEEFLLGPHPLGQFKYIRDCVSVGKIPELILIKPENVHLEPCKTAIRSQEIHTVTEEKSPSLTQDIVLSTWSFSEPFVIAVHSVQKLSWDSKAKVSVQCSLYHGEERLCGLHQTSEQALDAGGCCSWGEEEIRFDLPLRDLPRAAKLCVTVFETCPTQKNGRFRKNQDRWACPVAWVNVTVFDHLRRLRAPGPLALWPSSQGGDDYSACMLRPLAWTGQNPNEEEAGTVEISFRKYHPTHAVAYPPLEEILEYANRETDEKEATPPRFDPQASKLHLIQLRQICEKDALFQTHEQDKELMWFLRKHCCEQLPNSLPKLARCLKWNDRAEVAEMTKLLQLWPSLLPFRTLELLDCVYPDPSVREFAVRCLRGVEDEELSLYLLQLAQALKHEPYLDGALVRFLLERAVGNRSIGHRLFWLLRSEVQVPALSVRFGLILEAYCRSIPFHLGGLERQVDALAHLKQANSKIQNQAKKEGKEKAKTHILKSLTEGVPDTIFRDLINPLDPRYKFGKLRAEKCKCLDSKMKPLWLVFENTDVKGSDVFLIYKNGDDLRQDMLTLQMIRIMDRLWKQEGLDLRMIPYGCLATGPMCGLIEVVSDANTIANIQKEKGFTATSAFKKGSLLAWLKDHNKDEKSMKCAAEEFTLSCAGYCVATYVLGVADRHSDNIMVKTNGQLFHVDFGHILGKFKEKFGVKRERVPFVLTHDFVYIITRGQTQRSHEFSRFQHYCERAFMILRTRGPLVISLFAMMLSTGLPELSSERDLEYLRDTLVLDLSEGEALRHFRSKFDEALRNSWKTSVNWTAHNLAKDNKISD